MPNYPRQNVSDDEKKAGEPNMQWPADAPCNCHVCSLQRIIGK